MVQVIEVPDSTPVLRDTTALSPSSDPGLLEYQPPEAPADGAHVLSVLMPASGGSIDPQTLANIQAALTSLDGRVDALETDPPSTVPSGPAGGDLAGFYPNPTLGQTYATTTALATGLGAKAPRITVRTTTTPTSVNKGELLRVDASNAVTTINPPANPEAGDTVTIVKVDPSGNDVVFNAAVASDASAEITGRWSGATFVYDGTIWLVHSVNVAYSAAPSASGGTGTGLTREQADTRYEPLGAAVLAFGQVTKDTVGLGNVANLAPADLPISSAVQAALNTKQNASSAQVVTQSGTITLNAANGPYQAIIATGNVVLAPPSNPADQQGMRIEVFAQPGSSKTVSILSAVSNVSGQTFPFTIPSARCGVIGLVYSARAERWLLMSYVVETA